MSPRIFLNVPENYYLHCSCISKESWYNKKKKNFPIRKIYQKCKQILCLDKKIATSNVTREIFSINFFSGNFDKEELPFRYLVHHTLLYWYGEIVVLEIWRGLSCVSCIPDFKPNEAPPEVTILIVKR